NANNSISSPKRRRFKNVQTAGKDGGDLIGSTGASARSEDTSYRYGNVGPHLPKARGLKTRNLKFDIRNLRSFGFRIWCFHLLGFFSCSCTQAASASDNAGFSGRA